MLAKTKNKSKKKMKGKGEKKNRKNRRGVNCLGNTILWSYFNLFEKLSTKDPKLRSCLIISKIFNKKYKIFVKGSIKL